MKPILNDISNSVETFSDFVRFIDENGETKEKAGTFQAEVGLICWISMQSVGNQAMVLCKKTGLPVAALYLKSFNPFPKQDIEIFLTKVKKLIVIEEDETVLLSRMIHRQTGINPIKVFPPHGSSVTPEAILEKVKENFSS
jgi:pyruvate/2-oxoacid:ferredoxin oxidoreductase alpha subunit